MHDLLFYDVVPDLVTKRTVDERATEDQDDPD